VPEHKAAALPWLSVTGLPATVIAGQTYRHTGLAGEQGVSLPPFDAFNLALHVGDDPTHVQTNRMALLNMLAPYGCNRLVWLNQVHGIAVHRVTDTIEQAVPTADAVVTDQAGIGCIVMTADCLPVVLVDEKGSEVACAHAGWRGLLSGVIEASAQAMQRPPVYAWLGAAIGPDAFEVGAEVFEQFVAHDEVHRTAFTPQPDGKYKADLYQLARHRLQLLGIDEISGGEHCTVREAQDFYSYRRDHKTGRMATVVMIRPSNPQYDGP